MDTETNELPEGPDGLYQALTAWSDYMHDVAKLARMTIKGKLQEATKLTGWLADQDLISTREITAGLLAAYTVESYGHLGDQTYNQYLCHLRTYVAFLRKKRLLGDDLTPETDLVIRRRPQTTRPKSYLYPEDLLEKAEKAGEHHVRNKYFVLFAFYMTRRAGEMTALRWKDIDTTPRKGYKYGVFRFRNNKIGGEVKPRPINPLLLPYVLEWQQIFADLLREQFGLHPSGKPKRVIRATDYVFPAIDTGGKVIPGVRRQFRMHPDRQLPYNSIWANLKEAGIRGIHSTRRGGMIDLDERFGLEAASTMADHKTLAQSADYLDMDRKAEAVGELMAKAEEKKAKKDRKKAEKAAAKAGVPSLKDRRAGARRAS